MKTIQLLLIFLFVSSFLYAQQCVNNPSVQAGDINPAPLTPGVIGNASFTYYDGLTDYDDWENAPVKMTVCLLNITPTNGKNSVSGKAADWFDWIYDEPSNCFQGIQNQKLFGGEGGDINVEFEVQNQVECGGGPSQMGFNVNIQPAPCMNGVNLITDDNESVYTCYDSNGTPTGINELSDLGIEVMLAPNPATNQINFNIDSKTFAQANVTTFDILGKVVKEERPINIIQGANNFELNISDLNVGTYFLSVQTEDGSKSSFKFVKTNK